MKMVFRWFGKNHDNITLDYIKQIPGVTGIVTSLMDVKAGEVWDQAQILSVKDYVKRFNLEMEVIESVNIHEDIKMGLGQRDQYIENYIKTIRNLSKAGIKCICYNFMPVFDWLRTNLYRTMRDGSSAMYYDSAYIDSVKDISTLIQGIQDDSNGFVLPGWESERLAEIQGLFDIYKHIDEDRLFENLRYFLEAVLPECEKSDIKMAIHPDDPPWEIYGLPRIITSENNLNRLVGLVNSPYNCVTLCSGSLGASHQNDIPKIIRSIGSRIAFAHVRNIKREAGGSFGEVSHLSGDGSLDIYEIMKAYYDIGFNGYVRPDHGRMIWNEKGRAGYGLYDRALGITYLNGLIEAISKNNKTTGG
ncbi:MAG TPA: mannonate dehydratase [Clostridia bacterium]|nr:mannonate dehydratase [Clostridia bacterium]